ncbi:hypothetical protein [uncultured Bacteroides sp.]|uniref:Uncharacterized protein n=1 Tax=Myoviridae sp. ctgpD8 TaxID=2825149 RepID=A0A8S5QHR5_9CAUD|nr:hypothetical protein [uncultured Bacteroides sp.]DAE18530.1 MAG TPA: hypothetical protein [Myoviridae sp. ctgpD8]
MSSIGTELKINVHVEPIDGFHMSDYDFTCRFYIYANRYVELGKSEMIRMDDDNYIACIDSSKLGTGNIMMRIMAYIPDADFSDGFRTEVETVDTMVIIRK